jgi:type II secretory pathway pseudopilin PulG
MSMWSRRKPDERRRSAGFVLIEVLVTAAVAAVLLAAVMRAYSSLWSGIGAVREEIEAMLVARAVIEASTPRTNLVPLTQEGRTGRYVWSIAIASTGIVQQQQQQQPGQPAPIGQPGLGASGQAAGQAGLGATGGQAAGQPQDQQNNPDGQQEGGAREAPWTLFRIAVAVRAPSGRRTDVETYRLSRPAAQ